MAINSSKVSFISGQGFSKSELQIMFPSNSSPSLFNYVANGIATGLTKNQILSAARYLSYIEGQGFDIETFSGTTYAKKTFASGTNSYDPGIFNNAPAAILIVAGGGSGGGSHAGGGGAGGMVVHPNYVTTGTSTAVVGAGAPGPSGTDNVPGVNGSNSSIYGMTAIGGGAGGTYPANGPGYAGGNGGGGGIGGSGATPPGGGSNQGAVSGATVYGNAGGRGYYAANYGGGGGGGAGQVGAGSFTAGIAGKGGDGISYFGVTYAGGGGGMTHLGTAGQGGAGGGGAGGSNSAGTNGQANTGSGGGGNYATANAGLGGSGIIIIRYPLTIPSVFGA